MNVNVKNIKYEDFVNYKKPSMFIAFPNCDFKCEKECGKQVCQNSTLAKAPNIKIEMCKIIKSYIDNPITSSIVIGGLEPFYDFDQLAYMIDCFRGITNDDIVIYTGYYKDEIKDYIKQLKSYKNIIIKFGRFIPNQEKHFDKILGVYLASKNQFAERIS